MVAELKECRDKIKTRNTPKSENLVTWDELRRIHLLKQVELLKVEVKVVQHGHITHAVDKDGVLDMHRCGRASLRGDFTRFCREMYTISNKCLNRRDLLSQAMSEETWYKQMRDEMR